MQVMKWIIKRVKIFTFSITSWNKILFDRSGKQLVTIEFGGNSVVKTRNPLCRGRASPFPGGTLPLFDPVPAACPLLVAPFPCCACLPSCVHTCVRACMPFSIVYAMPPRPGLRLPLYFSLRSSQLLSSFLSPLARCVSKRGKRASWSCNGIKKGYVERIDPRSGISRKILRSLARTIAFTVPQLMSASSSKMKEAVYHERRRGRSSYENNFSLGRCENCRGIVRNDRCSYNSTIRARLCMLFARVCVISNWFKMHRWQRAR